MTKQKSLRRTSVLVVAVLLITMSFLCVTLAKFTTSINGSTNEITVAKWNFTADNATETFTITFDADKLAPGDKGSFTVALANASDVKASYTVEAALSGNAPKAMLVSVSENSSGTLEENDSENATITWAWAYDQEGNDDNDWFNTSAYSKTITITVTVEGYQLEKTAN